MATEPTTPATVEELIEEIMGWVGGYDKDTVDVVPDRKEIGVLISDFVDQKVAEALEAKTAQPEQAEPKVKARWVETSPACFTLVDEDDLPCGKIWRQGSVWIWALDEEDYWPAPSEAAAKQALLTAVNAEVDEKP